MNITFGFACRDDCLDQLVPSDLRQLVAERDELQRVLSEIAKIAHEGGLHGYDTNFEAMNKVRRLSLRWWKNRAPLSQSMRHSAGGKSHERA